MQQTHELYLFQIVFDLDQISERKMLGKRWIQDGGIDDGILSPVSVGAGFKPALPPSLLVPLARLRERVAEGRERA